MKIRIAYLEEPPFGWSGPDGAAMGADIDLATVVLRAIGATEIEHCLTTFSELLDGVATGRWDMNVPLFITPERAQQVAFSVPVWAMADGFLVRADNDKALGQLCVGRQAARCPAWHHRRTGAARVGQSGWRKRGPDCRLSAAG